MSKLYFSGTSLSNITRFISIPLIPLILTACAVDEEDTSPLRVRSVATVLGLTGDPTTNRILPNINDAKAQLGKKLFFTKGLGGNKDTACVSCHHPSLGGSDKLSLSIGVNAVEAELLGPGRTHSKALAIADSNSLYDGGPTVPRNSPTTFNVGLWDQVLFHDGRVESIGKTVNLNGNDGLGIVTPDSDTDENGALLADPNAGDNLPTAQSRFPVTSPEEMRGHTFEAGSTNEAVRDALVTQLQTLGGWESEFLDVYGDSTISYARIAEAIGEYERSQVFVNTPWKAFMEGDDSAISDAARRGALTFMLPTRVNGANCLSCHRGDFFTDERFHVLGMPQIGRGKGDGSTGTDDFGRFRVSCNDADMYAFRTPSLLNVTETGPWGHAGAYKDLEAVVRHHLDPQAAFDIYDRNYHLEPSIINSGQTDDMLFNTQNALDKLAANRLAEIASIQNISLTDTQVSDLVEFLHTLTDPCVKDRACLAPWIPDSSDTDPDGERLIAVDDTDTLL
jgi:cytochrome c peroxidase